MKFLITILILAASNITYARVTGGNEPEVIRVDQLTFRSVSDALTNDKNLEMITDEKRTTYKLIDKNSKQLNLQAPNQDKLILQRDNQVNFFSSYRVDFDFQDKVYMNVYPM